MRPQLTLLTLAALLIPSGAAAVMPLALPQELARISASPYCAVRLFPDYHLGLGYYARFRLAANCPAGSVGRVRKTSRLSTRVGGARWQPVKPDGSRQYGGLWSWTVWKSGASNIPTAERWTFNWAWQYWDGRAWREALR